LDFAGSSVDLRSILASLANRSYFPTDSASLEGLLRDPFENHWGEITFGPIMQGAAWEMRADRGPTYVGVLDGYLTIAFGVPHFHISIGETKGPRSRPTSRAAVRASLPTFATTEARACLSSAAPHA
jgi:hypothetical protein